MFLKYQAIIFITIILTVLFSSFISAEEALILLEPDASCITSSCHADMGKKKYVHAVGVDVKHCSKCHEVLNEGEHNFRKIPENTRSLCMKCHSQEFAKPADIKGLPPKVIKKDKKIIPHTPFAEGKCTECHDVHESDFQTHLKADYPEENYSSYSAGAYSLCLKCHKDFEKVMTEPRMLAGTKFRNGNLNLHFRHINRKKGRACSICHHHHGSEQPKLIRETFLFGRKLLDINYTKTETGGSCAAACHITVKYDRYEPVINPIKTTPRKGRDATGEELMLSREKEMLEDREIPETTNKEKGEER